MKYEFNDHQKEIINTKLKEIKDDIQRLSEDIKTAVFSVPCGHLSSIFSVVKSPVYVYILCIEKNSEKFECGLIVRNVRNQSFFFGRHRDIGLDCRDYSQLELYMLTTLIQNYPLVRKKVIKKIKKIKNVEAKAESKKKDNDQIIASILSDEIPKEESFKSDMDEHKEAHIEFQYPDTINMNELELKEENGRRVGLIDFGDMCVKILTNGDISLASDESQSKSSEPKKRVKLFKKFSSK